MLPPPSIPPPSTINGHYRLRIDNEPDEQGQQWAGLFVDDTVNRIKPHSDKWSKISIHTAKCDHCSEHNTSVIQRCGYCNRQICYHCMKRLQKSDKHYINYLMLDWTPEPLQKDTPGAVAKRGVWGRAGPKSKPGPKAKLGLQAKKGAKTGAGVTKTIKKEAAKEVTKEVGEKTMAEIVKARSEAKVKAIEEIDDLFGP